MSYKIGPNLTRFSIAGIGVTSDLRSFSLKMDSDELDASVLTQLADRVQPGQSQLTLDFSIFGQTGTCSQKISGLNLSALTVGGTSFINSFTSLSFNMDTTQDDTSAAADLWKSNQVVGYQFSVDCECLVPTARAHEWFIFFNSNPSRYLTLSFTLGSTTITIPMAVTNAEYMNEGRAVSKIRLTMKGHPPCVGTYPTSPTSAVDLLTTFITSPQTAVNVEIQSASANAEIVDFNALLSSMSFTVERNTIVENSYTLVSVGTPANTIS